MADPFALLGLEASFELDKKLLTDRHREVSRTLHPDRFVGRPSSERRAALGKAIEVNEAHRNLKNPLTRAEALLARLGVESDETSASPADPMFLMEIMELREELRAAGKAGDADKVEALSDKVSQDEATLTSSLVALFRRALGGGGDGSELSAIQQQLGTLRYYRRFNDEAGAILDEIL